MKHEIRIPKLGVAMDHGQIVQWHCAHSDVVASGSVIYTLATDKTETEIESPAAGTITVIGEVDQDYPVGTLVAVVDDA